MSDRTRVDYSALDALPGAVPKPTRKGKAPAPKQRKAVKAVNTERRDERRAECFGEQTAAARRLPCCGCGRDGPSEPHHEPPRSVGGVDEHVVPLCRDCHSRRHNIGAPRFWTEVGLSPEDVQVAVRDWMRSGAPPARFNPRG